MDLTQFEIVISKEEGYYVAYSPVLDLEGLGLTDQEAVESLLDAARTTAKWAKDQGTLDQLPAAYRALI